MRTAVLLLAALGACGDDGGVRHLDAHVADSPSMPDASNVDAGLTQCTKPANKALAFNGSQWVTIADSTSLHTTDLTIGVWAKFTASSGFECIVCKPYGTGTGDSFALWYQNGALDAGVNPTSPSDAISQSFTPTLNQWYQLTFTYDHTTSTQKLYVDGTLLGSSTTTSAPVYDTHPAIIGGDTNGGSPGGFFVGEIDEVKLWDSVRDLTEVGVDLHSCTPGSFTGLRAYWALDEGTGQTTTDLSNNGNAGALGDDTTVDAHDPTWIDSTVAF